MQTQSWEGMLGENSCIHAFPVLTLCQCHRRSMRFVSSISAWLCTALKQHFTHLCVSGNTLFSSTNLIKLDILHVFFLTLVIFFFLTLLLLYVNNLKINALSGKMVFSTSGNISSIEDKYIYRLKN